MLYPFAIYGFPRIISHGCLTTGNEMPKVYVNVKLPEELAKEIDNILKERTFGYRSRGEFVIEATRTLLLRIKTLMKERAET